MHAAFVLTVGLLYVCCFPVHSPRVRLVQLVGLLPSSVEFLPLGFAFASEKQAHDWMGTFAHVDLAVIAPGPNNGGIACSTGVPFVVIALLGQARYINTHWRILLVSWLLLAPATVLLLITRAFTWQWVEAPQPVAVAEEEIVSDEVGAGADEPGTGTDESDTGSDEAVAGSAVGQEVRPGPVGGSATEHHATGTSSARRATQGALRRRAHTM